MSKRWLQAATAILSLIPIGTGIVTMLGISDPIYGGAGVPPLPILDSNLRFFGGLWLGLGMALLRLVRDIAGQTSMFRAIWGAIFLGGIGRLLSIILVGAPPWPFIGFTALELIGAPLFVYWQSRLAQNHDPG